MQTVQKQDEKIPLWTRNYTLACIGNFLSYFGFCMVLPVLPMFLIDNFGIMQAQAGLILASFTFAAMFARLFFAYWADLYDRKMILCVAMLLFSLVFLPYALVAGTVAVFVIVRAVHGFIFGAESVCANALITDIVHPKRRGEGFGYFGISNNLGFATGPIVGLYLYKASEQGFLWIVITAFILGILGLLCVMQIKIPKEVKRLQKEQSRKFSFGRIYRVNGIFAGISLILVSFPYGFIVSFAPLYAREINLGTNIGLFFMAMATGLVISRMTSGKLIDKGRLTDVIKFSTFFLSVVFLSFGLIGFLSAEIHSVKLTLFYIIGFFFGIAYGLMFPAFNTLFVNLSPDNRRAAASSTYLTNWDIGLGLGLVFGGLVMQNFSTAIAYLIAAGTSLISAIFFTSFVAGHFNRNKLR